MFFSEKIGPFCHNGFTRKYLSCMGRSWWGFLCSGLMSNFSKYTSTTNSITYPPPTHNYTRPYPRVIRAWRRGAFGICRMQRVFLARGNLVTLIWNRLRLCLIFKNLTVETLKSFALFIFPKLIKKY